MTIGGGLPTGSGPPAGTEATSSRSERIARWFEVPLLVAALLAIPVIVVQESNLGSPWEAVAAVLDWLIWGAFALQLVVMLAIVPDRRRWLADHPLEVLIVLLTPPFLPATLKVARVLPVVRAIWLLVLAHRAHRLFSLQGLRYVALLAFAIVVGGGTLFAAVEPEQNLSTWDGLWWALETVTTVAYGDIVPQTTAGRMVAAVVMTTGVGFVALLTGSFAQRFLRGGNEREATGHTPTEAEMIRRIDELSAQIADLHRALRDERR
jgi:voltage-gated potassium channel